jgi:hypothetical protein
MMGESLCEFEMHYCCGEDGRAYYAKGHVPIDAFKAELVKQVDADDHILKQEVTHCWMRVCRDFDEGHFILCEAKPNARGAFRATWIQDA